ncbi:hypothetical protein TRVL_10288 [Trypanosoma vivax]|nr:hypothetical protein TRVL_10288 [Trypanosoma vivax]
MHNAISAIQAMDVSATEVPKGKSFITTRNMWRQTTINIDIFEQDCQLFDKSQSNVTRREEACYNLKRKMHGKGGDEVKLPPLNTYAQIDRMFIDNISGYGCPVIESAYNNIKKCVAGNLNRGSQKHLGGAKCHV